MRALPNQGVLGSQREKIGVPVELRYQERSGIRTAKDASPLWEYT
jgi:hypothetical protein